VALRDDIPNENDYIAVEHLGKPILIQNQGDRIAAFHNVCAHRNSIVARQPRGNMPRIKCGYHGWEYNRDGVACAIPGGEHFKPILPAEFKLDRIRVEAIDRLIFIAMSEEAPTLEEQLGPHVWARLKYAFNENMGRVEAWTVDYECNWKILVENTLEDYHITQVHYATVGDTPPYHQTTNEAHEKYVLYENRSPDLSNRGAHRLASLLRTDAEYTYFQYISYPSLVFATTPFSSHLHLLIPTSATTCRMQISLFLPGRRHTSFSRILRWLIRWPAIKQSRQFVEEDRTICNDVQRAIRNARFPGVLGKREERVYAFQQYVLSRCG